MDATVERSLISGAVPTASAAHRWFNCAPSYLMELAFDKEQETDILDKGTRLHKAMERWQDDPIAVVRELDLKEDEIDLFERGTAFRERMIKTIFGEEQITGYVEKRGYLSYNNRIVASGRPDCCMNDGSTWYIEDFKSGRGEVEDPTENLQLQTLAAILIAKEGHNIKKLFVAINQPYVKALIPFAEIPRESFKRLIEKVATAAIRAMESHNEGHVAGEWCTYCKAAAYCPITRNIVKQRAEFREILNQVSLDDLGALLGACDKAQEGIEAIRREAIRRAVFGEVAKGFKLVLKPINLTMINKLPKKHRDCINSLYITETERITKKREITDEAGIKSYLADNGFTNEQIALISGELEKIDNE